MMKRTVGWLLALCLILSLMPAQAAPARERQAVEVTVDGPMQTLLDITVRAAAAQLLPLTAEQAADAMKESLFPGLSAEEAPSPLLSQAAVAFALESTAETTFATVSEAEALYSQLFTQGAYVHGDQALLDSLVTLTEDGIEVHPDAIQARTQLFDSALSAYVYSAEFDGTDVRVLLDVYAAAAEFAGSDVEEIPEADVNWLGQGELTLRFAPETRFGYTVTAFTFSPRYQDGDLSRWTDTENTEFEYSVKLPSLLGLADDDPAHRVWQSADGAVTLTVAARDKEDAGANAFDQAYARLVARNRTENLGLAIRREPDFSRFSAEGAGIYQLFVISEDLSWDYELTLEFPPERQAEYELYAEFIRNSLIMWGISNG